MSSGLIRFVALMEPHCEVNSGVLMLGSLTVGRPMGCLAGLCWGVLGDVRAVAYAERRDILTMMDQTSEPLWGILMSIGGGALRRPGTYPLGETGCLDGLNSCVTRNCTVMCVSRDNFRTRAVHSRNCTPVNAPYVSDCG